MQIAINDAALAYDRFPGRFARALAHESVDIVDPRPSQRVLDVGCGPGALTALLVDRVVAGAVSAADPDAAFVEATQALLPGVDVRRAAAERLPHADTTFDSTADQLVVHFMTDPVAGLREMARVTRPGGTVTACVWDNAGGAGTLSSLWRAARDLDPGVRDESDAAGAREGRLAQLAHEAGLVRVESSRLTVEIIISTFDAWWEPFNLGVGSGGACVRALQAPHREELRSRLERAWGPGPFTVPASAWCIHAEAARHPQDVEVTAVVVQQPRAGLSGEGGTGPARRDTDDSAVLAWGRALAHARPLPRSTPDLAQLFHLVALRMTQSETSRSHPCALHGACGELPLNYIARTAHRPFW
ncbi:MAG: methyltransferase domain-containing protein [Nocardioides sp.]